MTVVLNELVDTLSKKSTLSLDGVTPSEFSTQEELSHHDILAVYASDPDTKKEIDYFNNAIQGEYSAARKLSQIIEQCRDEIIDVRKKLENDEDDDKNRYQMIVNLMRLQDYYRQTLMELQNVKRKTDHLKHGLEQAQLKVWKKFNMVASNNSGVIKELPIKGKENMMDYLAEIKAKFQSKIPVPFDQMKSLNRNFMNFPYETYAVFPVIKGNKSSHSGSLNLSNCEDFLELSPTKENADCLFQNQNYKLNDSKLPTNTKPLMERNSQSGSKEPEISMANSTDSVFSKTLSKQECMEKKMTSEFSFPEQSCSEKNDSAHSLVGNIKFSQDLPREMYTSEGQSGHSLQEIHISYPNEQTYVQSQDNFLMEFFKATSSEDLAIAQTDGQQSSTLEVPQTSSTMTSDVHWQRNKLEENQSTFQNPGSSKQVSAEEFNAIVHDAPAVLDMNIHAIRGSDSSLSDVMDEAKPEVKLEREDDTEEFLEFMKTVPLTGDPEVDVEIYNFYREKFSR